MSLSTLRALGLFGVPFALLPLTPERPLLAAAVLTAYGALLVGSGGLSHLSKSALVYTSIAAIYLCLALFASLPTSTYGVQKTFFVLCIILPFSVIVASLVRRPQDVRYLLWGALILGIVVAGAASLTLSRDLLGDERYQWLGNLSAFAAVISLQGWIIRGKLVVGGTTLLAISGVAISAAKQSVALLLVGWMVILFSKVTHGRRAIGYLSVSALAVGIVVAQLGRIEQLPVAEVMIQRISALAPTGGGFTLLQRGLLFKKAWNCYLENPLAGIGIGHYADFPGYTGEMAGDTHEYPHNLLLEVLCEQGTLGFVVLLLPLGCAAWSMFRAAAHRSGEPFLGALILFSLAATTAGISGDLMSRPIWVYGVLMLRLAMFNSSRAQRLPSVVEHDLA